jgi:hypothetical protein
MNKKIKKVFLNWQCGLFCTGVFVASFFIPGICSAQVQVSIEVGFLGVVPFIWYLEPTSGNEIYINVAEGEWIGYTPDVALAANPSEIESGGSFGLIWSVADKTGGGQIFEGADKDIWYAAHTCTASGDGWTGLKIVTDETAKTDIVTPALYLGKRIYTLTCCYKDFLFDSCGSAEAEVNVKAVAAAVPICGNGIIETKEDCDLGAVNNGVCPVSCSDACVMNNCTLPAISCDPNQVCKGDTCTDSDGEHPGKKDCNWREVAP